MKRIIAAAMAVVIIFSTVSALIVPTAAVSHTLPADEVNEFSPDCHCDDCGECTDCDTCDDVCVSRTMLCKVCKTCKVIGLARGYNDNAPRIFHIIFQFMTECDKYEKISCECETPPPEYDNYRTFEKGQKGQNCKPIIDGWIKNTLFIGELYYVSIEKNQGTQRACV